MFLQYLYNFEKNNVTHIFYIYLETYVDQGVIPEGSTWSMNPIPPRCLGGGCSEGRVKSKNILLVILQCSKIDF